MAAQTRRFTGPTLNPPPVPPVDPAEGVRDRIGMLAGPNPHVRQVVDAAEAALARGDIAAAQQNITDAEHMQECHREFYRTGGRSEEPEGQQMVGF